jgi:small conductance mechanosensitive channel
MENVNIAQLEDISGQILTWVMLRGPHVFLAIVVLLVGLQIIKKTIKLMGRILDKREMDPTLKPFLSSLVGIILKAMLLISVASMVGIETTSFVAILGAAGLAIGLALQGTLQNFASGVMILIFKPFRAGDFIDAGGHKGTVSAIEIFNTKLLTVQNRLIIIPNSAITSSSIVNFSAMDTARVDFTIGISYTSNIKTAKDIIERIYLADQRVLKDPAPMVAVSNLGNSSVDLTVRCWVAAPDYWDVFFHFNEQFKIELEAGGISIPFPQMDVHLIKE